MRYLYFDIESIDSKHETICTFGYVLTDENFNIIDKDDILINPAIQNNQYDWRVIRSMLAYPLAEIETSKTFPEHYTRIKSLLAHPQNIVLGFAVANDLIYINKECKRYGIDEFNIKCFDVQDFYRQYQGEEKRIGLKKLVDLFEIDCPHCREHLSRDDAEMTMLVAKAICEKMNLSIGEMLELCDQSYVQKNTISEFTPVRNEKTFKKNLKRLQMKYENMPFKKTICFSDTFEYNEELFELVKEIYKKGYSYTNTVSQSDLFIAGERTGIRDERLNLELASGAKIKKLTMEELKTLLTKDDEEEIELSPAMLEALQQKGITYEEYKKSLIG